MGQDYSIQKNVGKISLEQIDSVSCTDHRLEMSIQGGDLLGDGLCRKVETLSENETRYLQVQIYSSSPQLHVSHLLLSAISFQKNHSHSV